MVCCKCGVDLPQGSIYCHQCGKKQISQPRKATKRGNGTGSVYRVGDKWVAVKTIGYRQTDKGMKLHRITRKGLPTKKAALAALETMQPRKKERQASTWAGLYAAWLEKYEPTVSHSTINCYKAGNNYFSPLWNEIFSEIDIDDLQECLDECPAGKRTRQNMKTMAGLLYKFAIPRHQATINLGTYLRVTGEDGTPREAFTKEEVSTLRQYIGIVPYAEYIYCHIYLGFRPAELLALTRESYHAEGSYFIGGAKTEAGTNRTVTVAPQIQPIIEQLLSDGREYIFAAPNGGRMSTGKYRELFAAALALMGLPCPALTPAGTERKLTPHCCRHTFATMVKSIDAPDKDKLSLIGHTDIRMLQHYQHTELEDLRRVTNALWE